jgi:hypothetical protein
MGRLVPSATHASRIWQWQPSEDGTDLEEGVLTLILGSESNPSREIDCYAVQEYAAPGWIGRAFLLLNLSDRSQPDVYSVLICADGTRSVCDCRAGRVGRYRCKHVDGIAAILHAGLIPPRTTNNKERNVVMLNPLYVLWKPHSYCPHCLRDYDLILKHAKPAKLMSGRYRWWAAGGDWWGVNPPEGVVPHELFRWLPKTEPNNAAEYDTAEEAMKHLTDAVETVKVQLGSPG